MKDRKVITEVIIQKKKLPPPPDFSSEGDMFVPSGG